MLSEIVKKSMYKLLVGLFLVAAVVGVSIGAMAMLGNLNSNVNDPVIVKQEADKLKGQAIEQLNTNTERARQLFDQAKSRYESINDTDNIVDVEAQLTIIDYLEKQKTE